MVRASLILIKTGGARSASSRPVVVTKPHLSVLHPKRPLPERDRRQTIHQGMTGVSPTHPDPKYPG